MPPPVAFPAGLPIDRNAPPCVRNGSTTRSADAGRVVLGYSTKSLALIVASVVAVSLICMSAASVPPVLTSTMRSGPAMSLMRTWPAAVKAPL